MRALILALYFGFGLEAAGVAAQTLANKQFDIRYSSAGLTSLKHVHDVYDTDYIDSGRALGDVLIRYRKSGETEWRLAKAVHDPQAEGQRVSFSIGNETITGLAATETFQLEQDALRWTLELQNQTSQPIEIGDLALPLPFNTRYVRDKTETYTKRLIRHSFIGGNSSYVFWMRTNGEGPFLLMTLEKDTQFEYFESGPDRTFTTYLHSSASQAELAARGGRWRLPATEAKVSAKGTPGDRARYRFKFRWAMDYEAVRDVLYQEGAFDVNVAPGMTIPTDLTAMVSLRTHNQIRRIISEHPEETSVKDLGTRGQEVHLYQVKFSRLGENMLKFEYAPIGAPAARGVRAVGPRRYLFLEFFVTEPLETLIKKRARFLVTHEQWKDPELWYAGLYSQWDMKRQVLRSPDDLDGLQSYAVACDDPALGKAPFVAEKNVFFPDQQEIDSLEYYIRHYVWGGLQETDVELYPYAIYGIPNWKTNRESPYDDRRGKKHVWRIYDYPHVILLYYNMYLIARNYPKMVHYLDPAGYLERAFGTAIAFFTVPLQVEKWSAYETGTYNELVIPHLIQALEDNGRHDQAQELRAHWETKVKHFILDRPYLFGSEYPFDSTGFESTHALAKYAMERLQDATATEFRAAVKKEMADDFLELQMKLNLACRGMEPAYYWLGSDYRAGGNTGYTLSYMSQMGGWAVEDYAENFAKDPTRYLRLGYASYLSSWALLNSGTAKSNYGYWFPGRENDGGASGGFEPRPWGHAWLGNKEMGHGPWWYSGEIDLGFSGALRTAATVVADDPIFGLFAYGGDLTSKAGWIEVLPKDGLRARFHIMVGGSRLQMEFSRDGFARDAPIAFDRSLRRFTFLVENRSGGEHETVLHFRGLPVGDYRVTVAGVAVPNISNRFGEVVDFKFPVRSDNVRVTITRNQERTQQ